MFSMAAEERRRQGLQQEGFVLAIKEAFDGSKLGRRSVVLSSPVALSVSEPAAMEHRDLLPSGPDQLYCWGRGYSPAV